MKWQFIIRNVADCVDTPKPNKYKPTILNNEEVIKLIKVVSNTDIDIAVIIAIYTGMRRGEILGLTWNNIDLEKGIISVVQALYPSESGLIFSKPIYSHVYEETNMEVADTFDKIVKVG